MLAWTVRVLLDGDGGSPRFLWPRQQQGGPLDGDWTATEARVLTPQAADGEGGERLQAHIAMITSLELAISEVRLFLYYH